MIETTLLSLLHNASLLLAMVLVFDLTTSRVRLDNQLLRQILIGTVIGGLGVALIPELLPFRFARGFRYPIRFAEYFGPIPGSNSDGGGHGHYGSFSYNPRGVPR